MRPFTLGIIGTGHIAGAIVDGLCGQSITPPDVFVSPRNQAVAAALADRHRTVQVSPDNQAVVDNARMVILAVRSPMLGDVLADLRIPDDRIVISAVAGASHESLRRHLGEQVAIVRAIPLPAVKFQNGITAIYPAHTEVKHLFDSIGDTLVINHADDFTAIQTATATISSHLHYLATIATWIARRGICDTDAEAYVRSMFLGVANGLEDRTRSLPQLAVAHETPEGINDQFRRTWFTEQNSAALTNALEDTYAHLARETEVPHSRTSDLDATRSAPTRTNP